MTEAAPQTLTQFLQERIDADEAWTMRRLGPAVVYDPFPGGPDDPHRVLDEVEAKRRILAMSAGSGDFHQGVLAREGYRPFDTPSVDILTRVQQILALPYADHPAYREEWRP